MKIIKNFLKSSTKTKPPTFLFFQLIQIQRSHAYFYPSDISVAFNPPFCSVYYWSSYTPGKPFNVQKSPEMGCGSSILQGHLKCFLSWLPIFLAHDREITFQDNLPSWCIKIKNLVIYQIGIFFNIIRNPWSWIELTKNKILQTRLRKGIMLAKHIFMQWTFL